MTKRTTTADKKPQFWRSFEDVAAALRAHHGLVGPAAEQLGVQHASLLHRIQRDERLQEVLAEARERTIDVAESSLYRDMEAGEAWAVCFFLKTQAKHRGYIETVHHQIDITTQVRAAALELGLDPDEAVKVAETIVAASHAGSR